MSQPEPQASPGRKFLHVAEIETHLRRCITRDQRRSIFCSFVRRRSIGNARWSRQFVRLDINVGLRRCCGIGHLKRAKTKVTRDQRKHVEETDINAHFSSFSSVFFSRSNILSILQFIV